jgi:hypothetical protein
MTDSVDRRTPAERVEDVPMILEAMRRGVREALLRHKQAGNPVAVWRDGRVVWIPAEEIPVEATESPEERGRRGSRKKFRDALPKVPKEAADQGRRAALKPALSVSTWSPVPGSIREHARGLGRTGVHSLTKNVPKT